MLKDVGFENQTTKDKSLNLRLRGGSAVKVCHPKYADPSLSPQNSCKHQVGVLSARDSQLEGGKAEASQNKLPNWTHQRSELNIQQETASVYKVENDQEQYPTVIQAQVHPHM